MHRSALLFICALQRSIIVEHGIPELHKQALTEEKIFCDYVPSPPTTFNEFFLNLCVT